MDSKDDSLATVESLVTERAQISDRLDELSAAEKKLKARAKDIETTLEGYLSERGMDKYSGAHGTFSYGPNFSLSLPTEPSKFEELKQYLVRNGYEHKMRVDTSWLRTHYKDHPSPDEIPNLEITHFTKRSFRRKKQ